MALRSSWLWSYPGVARAARCSWNWLRHPSVLEIGLEWRVGEGPSGALLLGFSHLQCCSRRIALRREQIVDGLKDGENLRSLCGKTQQPDLLIGEAGPAHGGR